MSDVAMNCINGSIIINGSIMVVSDIVVEVPLLFHILPTTVSSLPEVWINNKITW